MDYINVLLSNFVLNAAVISWFLAQFIKTVLYLIIKKEFNWERLVGAGGMPSSHSATVCSMTVALSRTVGFDSPVFAVAVVISAIVMYDAMGVRRQAGEHAKAINIILKKDKERNSDDAISREIQMKKSKYKEFLGHTPIEVLGGALLGIAVALILPI